MPPAQDTTSANPAPPVDFIRQITRRVGMGTGIGEGDMPALGSAE